jgi:hypothetical protein
MSCNPNKLRQIIEASGLSYKQNSVSYIFTCPKCLKDDKLYLRKRDGRFTCWVCKETDNYQGRPEYALADLMLLPLSQVKQVLYGVVVPTTADALDLQLGDFFGEGDEVDREAVELPTRVFPYHYYPISHPLAHRGLTYLENRGIPLDVAMEYHLRFSPVERRVIFPVEVGSRLVGWQGRTVVDNQWWDEEREKYVEVSKILSSKDIPTANTVMFANRLKGSSHVVVCEGPVDAMKAHLCGGNVATMGKAIGQGQIKTIRDPERLTRLDVGLFSNSGIEKVYLALDPDAARETARLVREFSDLAVYVMTPPPQYKDFGEMTFEQVYQVFQTAERVGPGRLFVHFKRN